METRASQVTIAEIEKTICEVADIKAARIVTSSEGTIQEIHILALPSKSPKQLVRDVESVIMASFGIPIDHKKISIAQLGSDMMPKPDGAKEDSGRPRIRTVNSQVSGVKATITVDLEFENDSYVGTATGAASQTQRLRLVAQATLNAVEQYMHGAHSFALEDVSIVPLGRERVAVCCIVLVTPIGEQTFSGSALVRQNEKDSVVKATLDAINRRFGFLTSA